MTSRKCIIAVVNVLAGILFTSVSVMAGTIQMWSTIDTIELTSSADAQDVTISSSDLSLSAGSGIRTIGFEPDGSGLSLVLIEDVMLEAANYC